MVTLGETLLDELQNVKGKTEAQKAGKRAQVMGRWLGGTGASQQFKDPAERMKKK